MVLAEILQSIADNAGSKKYYVRASVETKDGDMKCINVSMDMIQKPAKDETGPCCCYPGEDKAGIVDISETETTKSTEKPKSKAAMIKKGLKVMEE